jgi:hypothetical protein
MVMMIARTAAKIGRSMKKWEKRMVGSLAHGSGKRHGRVGVRSAIGAVSFVARLCGVAEKVKGHF